LLGLLPSLGDGISLLVLLFVTLHTLELVPGALTALMSYPAVRHRAMLALPNLLPKTESPHPATAWRTGLQRLAVLICASPRSNVTVTHLLELVRGLELCIAAQLLLLRHYVLPSIVTVCLETLSAYAPSSLESPDVSRSTLAVLRGLMCAASYTLLPEMLASLARQKRLLSAPLVGHS
jgi:hypothetical protein